MTPHIDVTALTRATNHLTTDSTGDWRDQAACRDKNPETWFDADLEPIAKAVCHGCPVWADCLTDAQRVEGGVAGASRFGVRGGMNPDERANLSRQQRRKNTPPRKPKRELTEAQKRRREPRPPDCAKPTPHGVSLHRKRGERACAACSRVYAEAKAAQAERRAARVEGG